MIDVQYTMKISLWFARTGNVEAHLNTLGCHVDCSLIWIHRWVLVGAWKALILSHRSGKPTNRCPPPPIDFRPSNLLPCRYLKKAEEFKEKPLLSGSRTIVFTRFFVHNRVLFVQARMRFQMSGSVVFRSKSFTFYLFSQAGLSLTPLWHILSFVHFLHCPLEPLALFQH